MKVSKKLIASLVASLVMIFGMAAPVMAAAGNGVAGTFDIHDHGQGCWTGGSLFTDGTANGGGNCSFKLPSGDQEIISIDPQSWSFTDASHTWVLICFNFTVKQGVNLPGLSGPQCAPVPVSKGAPVNLPYLSPDTYGKVNLTGQSS